LASVTGAIAYHSIRYRTPDGEPETVRTPFGCIALLFCLRVLFAGIPGLI
jgi:hypothetical protein